MPSLVLQRGKKSLKKTCQNNRAIEILRQRRYFDDSDLVWLSEYVTHLSGDIFLSLAPCFHHLTHHSKHFNKAALLLERGLAGLDDTPINQACRASLLCTSDSGDWEGTANKGRKSGDKVKRASVHWRRTRIRLLQRRPSGHHSPQPQRGLPEPSRQPLRRGLCDRCLSKGCFCLFCLLHFKWFIYFLRQIYIMCPGWSKAQYVD